jgi:hypothetical protein
LLRRLRKNIKFAGMQPAWNVVGARPLGRISGQDRRLKLGEAQIDHATPDRSDDPGPQHDVGVHPLPPQIEKAVGQPHLLRVIRIGVDRKRQRLGLRLYFDLGDRQLDLPGIELGVDRVGGPPGDGARHCDKQQMAVVALAVDPARQPGGAPGIGKAQVSAGMAPVGVHRRQITQIPVANEGYTS